MVPGAREGKIHHFHLFLLASGSHMAIPDFKGAGKCNLILCFNRDRIRILVNKPNDYQRSPSQRSSYIEILYQYLKGIYIYIFPIYISIFKKYKPPQTHGELFLKTFSALQNHNLIVSVKMQIS